LIPNESEDNALSDATKSPDWSEVEKQLEPQYVVFFQESMGMPADLAREVFGAFVQDLKEAAHEEGTDRFPESFGEILLEREKSDESVRNAFAPKRADGVTDEDIALWWNMHDLERRLICKVDEMNRIMLFDHLVQTKGVPEPDAARMVAKRYPVYGDREHLVLGTDDDRPLPFELKGRINRYISNRMKSDPETFREETEAATSLNAVLRTALRQGEL
jgi:hypothetical protein